MRFALPSVKRSAAPPSLRLLPSTVSISAHSAVVGNWEEPQNIWSTVAKNGFVSWPLNFRVHILLKGAVSQLHVYSIQRQAFHLQHSHYQGFTLLFKAIKVFAFSSFVGQLRLLQITRLTNKHDFWEGIKTGPGSRVGRSHGVVFNLRQDSLLSQCLSSRRNIKVYIYMCNVNGWRCTVTDAWRNAGV